MHEISPLVRFPLFKLQELSEQVGLVVLAFFWFCFQRLVRDIKVDPLGFLNDKDLLDLYSYLTWQESQVSLYPLA